MHAASNYHLSLSTCFNLWHMYASPERLHSTASPEWRANQEAKTSLRTHCQPRVASLLQAQSGVKTTDSPERRASRMLKPRSCAQCPEWQVASK